MAELGNELQTVSTPHELRDLTGAWRVAGEVVGLVPTMGSLHAGHLSLIDRARRECAKVVVSIFVNPLQFGVGEDYLNYPRQLDSDLALLTQQGVDACYCPAVETLYPAGFATRVEVDAAGTLWEAERRPGHFTGVATVVTKLMAATGSARAYFGEKDAQQAAVVSRLALDLDLGAEVVICPTVRDQDGLAVSSRNQLISPAGRRAARCLSQALAEASKEFAAGVKSGPELVGTMVRVVAAEPRARLDYAGVVDPTTFLPVVGATGNSRALVAAEFEGVHLIDTAVLSAAPIPTS